MNYGRKNITEIGFVTWEEMDEPYDNPPDVAVLSSFLMYLPKPYECLEKLFKREIPYIYFDRTFFNIKTNQKERIMMQHVPKEINEATYPLHIFCYDELMDCLEQNGYRMVWEWDCKSGVGEKKRFGIEDTTMSKGFLLERK